MPILLSNVAGQTMGKPHVCQGTGQYSITSGASGRKAGHPMYFNMGNRLLANGVTRRGMNVHLLIYKPSDKNSLTKAGPTDHEKTD